MYIWLILGYGLHVRSGPQDGTYHAWRWRPCQAIEIWDVIRRKSVLIEPADGPYSGPEYPAGGPLPAGQAS